MDRNRLLSRIATAAGLLALPLVLGRADADSGADGIQCLDPVRGECPDAEAAFLVFAKWHVGCLESVDGPLPSDTGECCFYVTETCDEWWGRPACGGRPSSVGYPTVRYGRTQTPEPGLSFEDRRHLTAFWTEIALAEYASIAEFRRIAAELRRFGAPRSLIMAAHRAAGDEARHARQAFALASRYAGRRLSAHRETASPAQIRDLAAFAAENFMAGCVAETCSVGLCAAFGEGASDAQVRAMLAGVVNDELQHAELAWKIARWALQVGGEPVRQALRATVSAAPPSAPIQLAPASVALRAHGWLPTSEQDEAIYAVWRSVVLPVAEDLLRSAA